MTVQTVGLPDLLTAAARVRGHGRHRVPLVLRSPAAPAPPAQAAWLLVVVLSAWVVGFPRIRYPSDVLWAASQLWNWKEIASGTSYAGAFQTFGASSPFTHLWSLAVEEQIYLVMPVVILLLCRRAIVRRAGPVALAAAAVVIGAVSLVARRFVSANAVYLATPLRAGEVAAGVVAAIVLRRIGLRNC